MAHKAKKRRLFACSDLLDIQYSLHRHRDLLFSCHTRFSVFDISPMAEMGARALCCCIQARYVFRVVESCGQIRRTKNMGCLDKSMDIYSYPFLSYDAVYIYKN